MLNQPRLAGLVMAISAFNISDREIYALAQWVCELSGQVRAARLPGDSWPLSVAAYHSGFNAVLAAGGVPAGAAAFVDTVIQYSNWYVSERLTGAHQ